MQKPLVLDVTAALTCLGMQDVLHNLQHHTLTIEECTGSKCTTEVVNLHDTAMLGQQQPLTGHDSQSESLTNATDSRLGFVTIQKQVGKPLVVTVKQDESDPGQHVESGGALLTDGAKLRVASLSKDGSPQLLTNADPVLSQRASEIAEELSKHSAGTHREGDNVLDIHREDVDLSINALDPAPLSNRAHISDDNNLQIMQDSNSSSLLSGFNSDKARLRNKQQAESTRAESERLRPTSSHRQMLKSTQFSKD